MKVTLFSVLLLLLVGSAHAMDLIVKNMHYVMGEIPKHVYNAQVEIGESDEGSFLAVKAPCKAPVFNYILTNNRRKLNSGNILHSTLSKYSQAIILVYGAEREHIKHDLKYKRKKVSELYCFRGINEPFSFIHQSLSIKQVVDNDGVCAFQHVHEKTDEKYAQELAIWYHKFDLAWLNNNDTIQIFVGYDNDTNEPVSTGILSLPHGGCAGIYSIKTIPEKTRLGVAYAMISTLATRAKINGYNELTVQVHKRNEWICDKLCKKGFVKEGVMDVYAPFSMCIKEMLNQIKHKKS